MSKIMYLNYSSSFDKITEINSSFDTAILRIAYHGLNRNNSFISKESFERNIKSMYNCPVVTNYDRSAIDENDNKGDFGSHDAHLEMEKDEDGNIKSIEIVNDTYPIGVVYESADYWWDEIEDESGIHEYLCTNVILWKRQDAYNKLKEDKIFNHSMEIEVTNGYFSEIGYYEIIDFQFTAFCILSNSIEPCFEGSNIQLFNKNDFKVQFTEMMKELKDTAHIFFKNQSSNLEVENIKTLEEGGKILVDEKLEILKKYNLTVEQLSFNIDEISLEDLESKINEQFSLSNSQLMTEIDKVLQTMTEMKKNYWGELVEKRSFYLMDLKDENAIIVTNNWDTYYGVPYSLNGDIVTLDFEAKVEYIPDWRPKQAGDISVFTNINEVIISEFEQIKEITDSQVAEINEKFNTLQAEKDEVQEKLDTVTVEYEKVKPELEEYKNKYSILETENISLQEFKSNTEKAQQEAFKQQQIQLKAELVENFSKLLTVEEVKAIQDKDVSAEDMEKEFKLLYAEKELQVKFSKKQKKTETEIPFMFTKKSDNNSWTSCIKK
ncbi:MAG: hypothetical protein PHY08_08480 [Candidatus Cloacimonetes bacterium]|nr:hypothetical protein [Candidatus Cloacimonadota bacterium]